MKRKEGKWGRRVSFDRYPSTVPRPIPHGALLKKELLATATKPEPSAERLAHFSVLGRRFKADYSVCCSRDLVSSWHKQNSSQQAALEQTRGTGLHSEQSWEINIFLGIFKVCIKCK